MRAPTMPLIREALPPHPATIQPKRSPAGPVRALPPHPATVVQPRLAPHPATVSPVERGYALRRAQGPLIQRTTKSTSVDDEGLKDALLHARKIIPFAGNIRSEILESDGNSLFRSNEQSSAVTGITLTSDDQKGWKPYRVYNELDLQSLKTSSNGYADSAFSDVFLRSAMAHLTGGGVCDDYSAVVFCYLLDKPPKNVVSMSRYSWSAGHSFVMVDFGDTSLVVDPWLNPKGPLSFDAFSNLMSERGLKGSIGDLNQFVYTSGYKGELPKKQGTFGAWKDVVMAKGGILEMIDSAREVFPTYNKNTTIVSTKDMWSEEFPKSALDQKAGRKIFEF